LSIALFGACNNGEEYSNVAEAFCDGWCGRAADCFRGVDEERCRDTDCLPYNEHLKRMREDLSEPLVECIEQARCSEVVEASRLDYCFDQASEVLGPSEEALRFCEQYPRVLFRCGILYGQRECVVDYARWDPAVLAEAQGCAQQQDCDTVEACLDRVFGG
jgi:hypothetical protein